MENDRLILFFAVAAAVLFPGLILYVASAVLLFELFRSYKVSRCRENCDKMAVELLFRLSAHNELTEAAVAEEMRAFPCFESHSGAFDTTGKLKLPEFGWRSFSVSSAISSSLETGNMQILTKALEQLSRKEDLVLEAKSTLASQKYTLIASIAVASAVMGIAASISGQDFIYYVLVQSFLSGIWLKFLGGDFYESLSLSVPLSLTGYFLSLGFV
jgi:hypothetical protein